MTDDDMIQFLEQQVRLLDQRLCDAKRAIKERDQTIDHQNLSLESRRRHAIEVDDYERPEVVAQILEHRLRGWSKARWQALAGLIDRLLSETRP